jgi:hypothetical protein
MLDKFTAAAQVRLPFYCVALLYLVLPNLKLLLYPRALDSMPRGYIDVECLLIGAAGVFLPRSAVFTALLLESFADAAYSVCYTYRFSLGDLLRSFHYVTLMPAHRVLCGLSVFAFSLAVCGVLALARPRQSMRWWTVAALLAAAAAPTAIDMFDGQNFLWRKDATLTSYRMVRSPALVLGLWQISAIGVSAHARSTGDAPMASASAAGISFLESRPVAAQAPNVVLIVVESWGLAKDARMAHALTAPYGDPRIAGKYKITAGNAPFTGLTVPGEARELCHSTMGFGILQTPPAMAAHCLPAWFHARGYETDAIHGFVGSMFYRSSWYPKLGFDRSWFGPDLHSEGLPDCPGAFPGVCDASIAGWIGNRLLSESGDKPRFIYWVTLNSHLPEPVRPNLPQDGVCATEPDLASSTALCSWFRLVRAVHQSVAEVALLQTDRPTVFILVGDHAPPFTNAQLRADFSSTDVPYEMLTPLAASAQP